MKSVIKILSFLIIYNFILFAQEPDSIKTTFTNDSLKTKIASSPLTQIQIKFDEFELHREFKDMKTSIPIDGDPQTIWLRTSLSISNSDDTYQNFSPYFLSPLERQYLEESKFDPVRYALGMVQAGAVGYLAYKHIKKYGFFK